MADGEIGGALVRRAYDILGDRIALGSLLNTLQPAAAEALITGLEEFQHDFRPEVVAPAVETLLNQMPRLREDKSNMFDAGGRMVVDRVVLRLLRRLDSPANTFEVVNEVLPNVPQLSGRLDLIDLVGHNQGVGHELISERDANQLYERWLTELQAASDSQLSSERSLFRIFNQAARQLREQVHVFIQSHCANDEVLLQLLRSALSAGFAQAMNTRAFQRTWRLPWEQLAFLIGGEDRLTNRVREVSARVDRESLSPRTRLALETAEKYASGEIRPEPADAPAHDNEA